MIRRALLALMLIVCGALSARAEEPTKETALDIIASDAVAALAIRNVKELTERGDEFIKKSEIKSPWRLSDGYRLVTLSLGLNRGLDESGSATLMLLDEDGDLNALVLTVPIGDFAAMAGNFKLKREDLVEGRVIDRREREGESVQPYARYLAVRGSHLVMGGERDFVARAAKAKPLRDVLPEEDRTTLDGDDILLYINTKPLRHLADLEGRLEEFDRDEAAALRQLTQASQDLSYLLGGVRLDEGFGSTFLFRFEGETSREVLTDMRGGKQANATLAALPTGRVLAAHASSGDGEKTAAAARALLRLFFRDLGPLNAGFEQFASAGYQANIVGVFGEVWQRLNGSRSALYENDDAERDGAFSLIAVLDTDDAERFVTDMTSLARFVSAATLDDDERSIDEKTIAELIAQLGDEEFRVRQLASTKLGLIGEPALPALAKATESDDVEVRYRARALRKQINAALEAERKDLVKGDLLSRIRPNFAHFPNHETRAGRSVDVVQIRLRFDETAYASQLRRMLGPEWSRLRLATVGNRVVVMLGSNLALFDQAIENVKAGKPSLDAEEAYTAFRSRAAEGRTAEFHLSLARAQKLVGGGTAGGDRLTGQTSLGLTIAPQRVRLDLFVPYAEVKSIASSFGF